MLVEMEKSSETKIILRALVLRVSWQVRATQTGVCHMAKKKQICSLVMVRLRKRFVSGHRFSDAAKDDDVNGFSR